MDLYLRVLNRQGGEVAVVDDAGTEDAKFTFTAPEDGEYTLVVEELNRRGGLEFIYRILTQPAPVDYSLLASTDRLVIAQEVAGSVLVSAARAGYGARSRRGSIAGQEYSGFAGDDSRWRGLTLTLRVGYDAPLGIHTLRLRAQAWLAIRR
ncbi:MAG: hypothetical protein U1D30_20545 [Planctomycetota bacterium]